MALCLMGCKRGRNVFPSLLWQLSFAFLKWDAEMGKETVPLMTSLLGTWVRTLLHIHLQKRAAPVCLCWYIYYPCPCSVLQKENTTSLPPENLLHKQKNTFPSVNLNLKVEKKRIIYKIPWTVWIFN